MKFLLLSCILCSTIGCTSNNIHVVPTSTWYSEWQQEKMKECHKEAVYLTLLNYEANGRIWNRGEVEYVERLILESCYQYENLTI